METNLFFRLIFEEIFMDTTSLILHGVGLIVLATIALVLSGKTYADLKKITGRFEAVAFIFLFLILTIFGWMCATAAFYIGTTVIFSGIALADWLPALAFGAILYSVAIISFVQSEQ